MTLTLNRPAALNAFTSELHEALAQALAAAAGQASVRAVVLTGAGRAFCAGQDLADPLVRPGEGDSVPQLGSVIQRHYAPLIKTLRTYPVPVVAAVNGVAAGAGASIALACDLVVAARSASFIQAFGKVGLIPDSGGTWLLPRLVGRARALGLALLGDRLGAEEAQRIGMIWTCVDGAELAATARSLAVRLAAMPVKALVATRMAMDEAQTLSLDGALAREAQFQQALGQAHDYREGVAAFVAKRVPQFVDR